MQWWSNRGQHRLQTFAPFRKRLSPQISFSFSEQIEENYRRRNLL